jgi:fructose-bisphosphate aldolase, class I
MATFCKSFTAATIRYFDHVNAVEAQRWLGDRRLTANARQRIRAWSSRSAAGFAADSISAARREPVTREMEQYQMKVQELIDTAKKMVAGDKGLLAMDESNPTCNKRFARLGIPQTEEARRAWRELIVTTPGLGDSISGAILYDETIRQRKKDGILFVKVITDAEIIPGIKVDTGAKDMAGHPGEKVTEGLDGLRDRLKEYFQMGARFAKWRAVITVGDGIPSRSCIEANAQALARYAALCQEAGLVPIVEPEVLMDGEHTLARCGEVTEEVLRTVFSQFYTQRVTLEGVILKPNMVLPGLTCPIQAAVDQVADATVECLLRAVPAAFRELRSYRAVKPLNWPRPV